MNGNLDINKREKYLIDLVFEHYKQDCKEDYFHRRLIKGFKKIFAKDKLEPSRGYLEDKDSVRIYEKIKAREINVKKDQCMIVAREGKVKSDIYGNIIYISGKVNGKIESKFLYVRGKVEGNIDAEYVEIFPKGRINGEVKTSRLIIHNKAEVKGNCQIK